jgi:hypothetical protein
MGAVWAMTELYVKQESGKIADASRFSSMRKATGLDQALLLLRETRLL